MEFFRDTHYNFIGARKFTYIFSAVTLLISLVFLFTRGPKYGVDFTGGTSIELKFENQTDIGDIRSAISAIGFGDAEIKHIGASEQNNFIIRVGQVAEGARVGEKIQEELVKRLPAHPFEVLSVTEIGPKIGGELRRKSVLAVAISLIGMLIYVAVRFEFKFGVGAIIALFHDVIFTLGFFSIMGFEMSLTSLAAFLTIVGYSINDTIVVFDRIRENKKILRRETLENIMNISVNQTLSRTLLTGVSTLVVLAVLFFAGGQVIHGFAFAMFVGTVIGTYSSIYVASVIVLDWQT
jgi:preprotein translocase subunit SecF